MLPYRRWVSTWQTVPGAVALAGSASGRGRIIRIAGEAARRRVQQLVAAQGSGVGGIGRTHIEVRRVDRKAIGILTVLVQPVGDVVGAANSGAGAVGADAALVARVERSGQLARLHALRTIIEAADIGVIALLIEVAGTGGQRQALIGVIAPLGNAGFGAAHDTLHRTLGDDVDHTRDRVRTIAGR